VAEYKREYFSSGSTVLLKFQLKPLVLLLDADESWTESLELIELARKCHVVLMYFPLHTNHSLQHLDVSFMAPLNRY
jgi:hypothetical protein